MRQWKSPWCLDFISIDNADSFLMEDNVIVFHLGSLNEQLVFYDLSYVLKHKQNMSFSISS